MSSAREERLNRRKYRQSNLQEIQEIECSDQFYEYDIALDEDRDLIIQNCNKRYSLENSPNFYDAQISEKIYMDTPPQPNFELKQSFNTLENEDNNVALLSERSDDFKPSSFIEVEDENNWGVQDSLAQEEFETRLDEVDLSSHKENFNRHLPETEKPSINVIGVKESLDQVIDLSKGFVFDSGQFKSNQDISNLSVDKSAENLAESEDVSEEYDAQQMATIEFPAQRKRPLPPLDSRIEELSDEMSSIKNSSTHNLGEHTQQKEDNQFLKFIDSNNSTSIKTIGRNVNKYLPPREMNSFSPDKIDEVEDIKAILRKGSDGPMRYSSNRELELERSAPSPIQRPSTFGQKIDLLPEIDSENENDQIEDLLIETIVDEIKEGEDKRRSKKRLSAMISEQFPDTLTKEVDMSKGVLDQKISAYLQDKTILSSDSNDTSRFRSKMNSQKNTTVHHNHDRDSSNESRILDGLRDSRLKSDLVDKRDNSPQPQNMSINTDSGNI